MEKSFTLIQTIATAGVFSAVSFWYGFMFGRESARKELGDLIEKLRSGKSETGSPPHSVDSMKWTVRKGSDVFLPKK
ncbi:unnamed protein product [Camellia sinensis]